MCKFDFTRQEAETIRSKLYLTEDEDKDKVWKYFTTIPKED